MQITFTSTGGLPYFDVRVYEIQGREWVACQQNKIEAISLSMTFNPTNNGYYSFEIFAPEDVGAPGTFYSVNYTMKATYTRPIGAPQLLCYSHRAMPNIGSNLADITEVRVLAASGMITNKAALLQQGGQVAAVELPEGKEWYGFGYDQINGSAEAFSANAVKGVYGFLKPDGPTDWAPVRELIVVDGNSNSLPGLPGLSDAAFTIPNVHDSIAMTFLNPTGTSNQAAYYTAAFRIEYRTNNQLFAAAPSMLRRQEVEVIRDFVGRVPQFYSNDGHKSGVAAGIWEQIKSYATQFANAVTTYGPMVVDAAKYLLPLLV